MKIVIVTGMSGAGKTKAADWLEDQGYYCIDNMPPKLVMNFVELSMTNGMDKIAFVADVRGGEFFSDLVEVIDQLKSSEQIESEVFFVDAQRQRWSGDSTRREGITRSRAERLHRL